VDFNFINSACFALDWTGNWESKFFWCIFE